MTGSMRRVVSKDGTPIAFDRSGAGPAVILVCGASTTRAANAPLAALLAPHFTVFNYDRRGRGDSGDTAPYAVEREIEDLDALIKEAGEVASVFGTSSGAILALEAAAHGLAITKLALWEPPFSVDDDGPRRHKEYATRLAELLAAGRRGDAVALFMKQVGLPPEFVAQARNAPWWSATEDLAHTLAYDAAVMGDSAVPTERVASVTVPTLVLDGGASPAHLRNAARALADVLPRAQHRTLEGQTHAVDPEVLAPVLEAFFAG
jgi:pimeloyl-ACP methyl ester carboxylesterase